jgi:tryptophan synthase beta subunit
MSKENYNFPDKDGRYGDFGGKYVSETLISALDQLEDTYDKVKNDKSFIAEVKNDLETFVGRPSPLYFAQ